MLYPFARIIKTISDIWIFCRQHFSQPLEDETSPAQGNSPTEKTDTPSHENQETLTSTEQGEPDTNPFS